MNNAVVTSHLLDFEVSAWHKSMFTEALLELVPDDKDLHFSGIEWQCFRVGTVHGQYRVTPEAYEILSVINEQPGNGHLIDLLEWFEYACRRSRLPLRILAFTNQRFKKHFIKKHGFKPFNANDVQKYFK